MELQLDRTVKLRELNEHITCLICGGYLIDATTITECLHTFCRSCLVSRIEEEKHNCPKCGLLIHHSHPLQYIAHDRTMQGIVEKLVPGLQEREWRRQLKFYHEKNMQIPNNMFSGINKRNHNLPFDDGRQLNYHKFDDQVDVHLRSANSSLKHLKRPFIQCSVHATIKILKKYLAKLLGLGMEKHGELDILCNEEIQGKDHTLLFILMTRWRSKTPPLHLDYRPRITLL
uniref:Polycomb group RING finger protein 3 n=1 Tax=Phallusia mammillata TaxID=59560 RepID=A0A6F9DNE0_9ASCI|nr:polycomb group RING finger protein 3 [Phallusia mammillata]